MYGLHRGRYGAWRAFLEIIGRSWRGNVQKDVIMGWCYHGINMGTVNQVVMSWDISHVWLTSWNISWDIGWGKWYSVINNLIHMRYGCPAIMNLAVISQPYSTITRTWAMSTPCAHWPQGAPRGHGLRTESELLWHLQFALLKSAASIVKRSQP